MYCYLLSGPGGIPCLRVIKDSDSVLHLESKVPLSPAGPKVVKLTLAVPVLGKIKPADAAPWAPLLGHDGAPPVGARELGLGTVAGGERRQDQGRLDADVVGPVCLEGERRGEPERFERCLEERRRARGRRLGGRV